MTTKSTSPKYVVKSAAGAYWDLGHGYTDAWTTQQRRACHFVRREAAQRTAERVGARVVLLVPARNG